VIAKDKTRVKFTVSKQELNVFMRDAVKLGLDSVSRLALIALREKHRREHGLPLSADPVK
jgi:hypothetical protein